LRVRRVVGLVKMAKLFLRKPQDDYNLPFVQSILFEFVVHRLVIDLEDAGDFGLVTAGDFGHVIYHLSHDFLDLLNRALARELFRFNVVVKIEAAGNVAHAVRNLRTLPGQFLHWICRGASDTRPRTFLFKSSLVASLKSLVEVEYVFLAIP